MSNMNGTQTRIMVRAKRQSVAGMVKTVMPNTDWKVLVKVFATLTRRWNSMQVFRIETYRDKGQGQKDHANHG